MPQDETSSDGNSPADSPHDGAASGDDDTLDSEEYDEMLTLERFESLEEEMNELGVTTLDEVRHRITQLHEEMDERES